MRKRNSALHAIRQEQLLEEQKKTALNKEELPQEVLINKVKSDSSTKYLSMAQTQALVDGMMNIVNSEEFKEEDVPAMEAYVNKFFIQPLDSDVLESSLNRLVNLRKFMVTESDSNSDVITSTTYLRLYKEATSKIFSRSIDMRSAISDAKIISDGIISSSVLFGFRGEIMGLFNTIFSTIREILLYAREGKFLSITSTSVGINGAMNIYTSFHDDTSFNFHTTYIGPGYYNDLIYTDNKLKIQSYRDRDYSPSTDPIANLETTIERLKIFMENHLDEYVTNVRSINEEIKETLALLASYIIKKDENPYDNENSSTGNYYLEKNALPLLEIVEQLKQNLYTTTETIINTFKTPIVQAGIHTSVDYTDRLSEMGL